MYKQNQNHGNCGMKKENRVESKIEGMEKKKMKGIGNRRKKLSSFSSFISSRLFKIQFFSYSIFD